MNIEQIAKEAWSEVCKSSSVGQSIAEPFLRRCLSKLAEQDVEPVAYQSTRNGFIAKEDKNPEYNIGLYTEAQLIAAQQRTAEACAKAVERLISGDGICADNEVWIHDCADAIRRGDWREYL